MVCLHCLMSSREERRGANNFPNTTFWLFQYNVSVGSSHGAASGQELQNDKKAESHFSSQRGFPSCLLDLPEVNINPRRRSGWWPSGKILIPLKKGAVKPYPLQPLAPTGILTEPSWWWRPKGPGRGCTAPKGLCTGRVDCKPSLDCRSLPVRGWE